MEQKYSFPVELSGLSVKIFARNNYCKEMCKDYIIPEREKYDIIADVTDAEIEKEMVATCGATERGAEFACIYRCIAKCLPQFSRAVFHGAAITYKEDGVLFTAKSGTGKTTHIKLWREVFGKEVKIINGDKPIIKVENQTVTAYGTPWAGKENWQKNRSAKLKAICVLARGEENKIVRLTSQECINELLGQIYLPFDTAALNETLNLLDEIIKAVPIYKLYCNISREAAELSFKTILEQ